ncbi:FTR1 family protein [Paenibacillus sp. CC-CFT747]|nr:FTR1 family protein [Paenibacillus sp. CC-CFT747]
MKIKLTALLMLLLLLLPAQVWADSASDNLKKANGYVENALQFAEAGDFTRSKEQYDLFNQDWYTFEEGIKAKSKGAYRSIEESMGEVQYAYAQSPVVKETAVAALTKLAETNRTFLSGDFSSFKDPAESGGKTTIEDLVKRLDQAHDALDQGDIAAAKESVQAFRSSWLDIEGMVLTQSSKVYADAERDMVSSYAMLTANPPKVDQAKKTIETMRDYLAPLAAKSSYTMLDVVTILLREGLEALLVIVALLGFLTKSGHADKRKWLWSGLGAGVLVSIVIGVAVQLLLPPVPSATTTS